jgi:hypothetical protein
MSHLFSKKGIILTLCGVTLLILSFMPLYAFLPSCLYWEARPYVINSQSMNQDLGFFIAGSYVKLNVYVYGGDGKISVQVLDVGLNSMTQEGSVRSSGFVAFEPSKSDYYSLYLTNGYGYDKQILIKVYYYFYNYIFFILGIVLLGLGVVLILNQELKNRKVNRSTLPPS